MAVCLSTPACTWRYPRYRVSLCRWILGLMYRHVASTNKVRGLYRYRLGVSFSALRAPSRGEACRSNNNTPCLCKCFLDNRRRLHLPRCLVKSTMVDANIRLQYSYLARTRNMGDRITQYTMQHFEWSNRNAIYTLLTSLTQWNRYQ